MEGATCSSTEDEVTYGWEPPKTNDFLSFLAYQPSKPDKTATDPNSWIALECGATEKFSATGTYKQNVPYAVYSNFNFMRTELESGWFAIQLEPDDKDDYGKKKLTKVCKSSWSFNLTVNLI